MKEIQLRPIPKKEEEIINRLLGLENKDIYIELGQNLGTLAPDTDPESQAKAWFDNKKGELFDLVCVKGNYCAFVKKNTNAKMIEIIAALSDLLASAFGTLPVYVIATLLVRMSLDKFCECDSTKNKGM